jgi:Flp pilus assembly protein TadD
LGLALAVSGNADEAILHSEAAARLSPRDPATGFLWRVTRSITTFIEGNYSDQLAWARSLTEIMPENPMSWRHLSVAAAYSGHLEEAQRAAAQLIRLVPHDSVEIARNNVPLTDEEDLERFCEGLRIAGLPE